MIYLIVSNAIAAALLATGVYALVKLGWADRFHHLWFGFAAFSFAPCFFGANNIADLIVRTLALVVAADDAIQHLVQWYQWQRYMHAVLARAAALKRVPDATPPDEGTGWFGIYRSPLHLAYWWLVEHL